MLHCNSLDIQVACGQRKLHPLSATLLLEPHPVPNAEARPRATLGEMLAQPGQGVGKVCATRCSARVNSRQSRAPETYRGRNWTNIRADESPNVSSTQVQYASANFEDIARSAWPINRIGRPLEVDDGNGAG